MALPETIEDARRTAEIGRLGPVSVSRARIAAGQLRDFLRLRAASCRWIVAFTRKPPGGEWTRV